MNAPTSQSPKPSVCEKTSRHISKIENKKLAKKLKNEYFKLQKNTLKMAFLVGIDKVLDSNEFA